MSKGRLFVISGPSGAGKGTICKELLERVPAVLSISATTRAPREGEREGIEYFFIDKKTFKARIAQGEFFEYADVYGEYYGTPKKPVEEQLALGKDVILEIDVQGAMQVKETCPEGVFIFVLPPSMAELRNRLLGRASETPEKVEIRMGKAEEEMKMADAYDYRVVNDEIERVVEEISEIMRREHLQK